MGLCVSSSWEGMTGSSGIKEALHRGSRSGIRHFLTVTLDTMLGFFLFVSLPPQGERGVCLQFGLAEVGKSIEVGNVL